MLLGIFAKTFATLAPAETCRRIKAAGYSCTQFNMSCLGMPPLPFEISVDLVKHVSAEFRAGGVPIVAISGTYNMIHPNPVVRANGRRGFRTVAGAAHAMGTGLVTLCTGTLDLNDQWKFHPGNREPEAWRNLLEEMEEVITLAEEFDVLLGVEPEPANVVASAYEAHRLLDELQTDRIRIVLDTANLASPRDDRNFAAVVQQAIDLLIDHTAICHAKDLRPDGQPTFPGNGIIDFRFVLGALKRAGFDGPVIAHGLHASEAAETARFLAQILVEDAKS
jgi:sugar phosphate isomerase/epimerase